MKVFEEYSNSPASEIRLPYRSSLPLPFASSPGGCCVDHMYVREEGYDELRQLAIAWIPGSGQDAAILARERDIYNKLEKVIVRLEGWQSGGVAMHFEISV
eukprot:1316172-Amorphochlora_amoeboformis.AAC.1